MQFRGAKNTTQVSLSRRFPYPPPETLREGARREAVLQPIKKPRSRRVNFLSEPTKGFLLSEKNTSKPSKSEQKWLNKDTSRYAPSDNKKRENFDYFSSKTEEEAERSDVTEEHGQSGSLRRVNCLSDGAQSSNKRKREDSVVTIGKSRGGLIVRIKLPVKKDGKSNASVDEQQLPSTSGTTVSSLQNEVACPPSKSKSLSTDIETSITCPKRDHSLDSRRRDSSHDKEEALRGVRSPSDEVECQYGALFETWEQPKLHLDQYVPDDQDWLFETKRNACKTPTSSMDVSRQGSSTMWPCAKYLAEADIHALPYTVPF